MGKQTSEGEGVSFLFGVVFIRQRLVGCLTALDSKWSSSKMSSEIVRWSMRGNLEKVDPREIKREILTAALSLQPDTDLEKWSDELKFQFMDVNDDGQGNMTHFGFEVKSWNITWAQADHVYSPLARGDDPRDKDFGCFVVVEKDFPVEGRRNLILDFSASFDWGNSPT